MGTPDRTTDDSAPSLETPDGTAVRTRYQAPIRDLRPASPEVSVPSTAMHRTVPAKAVPHASPKDAPLPAAHVAQTPTTSLNPAVAPAALPAFLRTYSRDETRIRQRQLRKNLLVRVAILSVLGLTEGLIIAQYTQPLAICFWLVAALYIIVQAWPLLRPPNDVADTSVYSIWAICSLIGYIGVGLVLSPITFLLLMLDWAGVSMGFDPMLVLCGLGLVWVSEVGLSLLTIYRFNELRTALTHPAPQDEADASEAPEDSGAGAEAAPSD